MAISFSRPDPSSPPAVAAAAFSTSRKGFEPTEVREFLRMVAAELARLQEREKFLERELRGAQRGAPAGAIALDEELVTKMLGEEAARILSTAREAASQIKIRAEEGAARLLREATDEAQRLREEAELESSRRRTDAAADAEAELEMAKQQGREMVNEARAYRERVLGELARRRELARQQIEQLVHGRDRLLQAFERARIVAVDVMDELTPLGEPAEYVDLSPTTGPVPVMVPGSPRPGSATDATAAIDRVLADVGGEAVVEAIVVEETIADDAVLPVAVPSDVTPPEDVEAAGEIEEIEGAGFVEETDEIVAADEPDDADDELDLVDDELQMTAEVDMVLEPESEGEDDTVVRLEVGSFHEIDDVVEQAAELDDEPTPANVVSLFGEPPAVEEIEEEMEEPAAPEAEGPRTSVDDLFARLRASRSADVAGRVAGAPAVATPSVVETAPDAGGEDVIESSPPSEDSVFLATPDAPSPEPVMLDTPFARRDEALTPIIVAAARKLKRVLADEQNEVLHTLRRKEPVRSLEAMLAPEADQAARYGAAIEPELLDAATAGAASMDKSGAAVRRNLEKAHATAPALDTLATELVMPLRDRLARCVADADGDNGELATLVRTVYREWKNQRIDEHLDDVARMAFGRGALVAIGAGTPICWIVDPNGPACPDAEDNSLGGVIPAGSPFPTDDVCAPAHSGCRCMIAPATT